MTTADHTDADHKAVRADTTAAARLHLRAQATMVQAPPVAEPIGPPRATGVRHRLAAVVAGHRWPPRPDRARRISVAIGLTAAYLLCSFGLWWAVWSGHPTSTYLCGCGDPGQYLWFFAAPADALRHGHLPFFTGADYHPGGVNMLDNPGVLGLAILAAPITWTLGPVAAVNTVLLVTPVLSALAGYLLLRRWVSWWPAAALGAGFFGFSPFVVSALEYVHLQAAFLALAPLILLCLDDLLVRHQHRPVPVGAALGVLVVVQYLVSPEMLVLVTLVVAVGLVLMVASAAWARPDELRRHIASARAGLITGAATALVLAAYPLWFALDGPRHTVGAPWTFIAETGNDIVDFVSQGPAAGHQALAPSIFGYLGDPGPAANYLGPTVIVAVVATVVALRRRPLVRLVAATAAIVAALSLGTVLVTSTASLVVHPGQHPELRWWLPWTVLAHVPLVNEASPSRLSGLIDLLVAVVGALGLDQLHQLLAHRQAATAHAATLAGTAGSPAPANRRPWSRSSLPAAVCLAAAAAVLVPVGLTYRVPLRTTTVTVPPWYQTVADHLPAGSVVLGLPWGLSQTSVWQAVGGMRFVMAGGDAFVPGPNGHVEDRPPRGSAEAALTDLSTFAVKPEPTAAVARVIRRSLARWGVTDVVVTPSVIDAAYDVGFLSAVLGMLPKVQAGAWVWTGVDHAPPPWPEPPNAVVACQPSIVPANAVARCVAGLALLERADAAPRRAGQPPATPALGTIPARSGADAGSVGDRGSS